MSEMVRKVWQQEQEVEPSIQTYESMRDIFIQTITGLMIPSPAYDSLLTVDRLNPVQAQCNNLSCCQSDISQLFPLPSSSYMFSLLFLNFRGSNINVLFRLSSQPSLNLDIWPDMNFCIKDSLMEKRHFCD